MAVVSCSCCNVVTLLLALAVVMLQSSLGIVMAAVCSEMEGGDVATAAVELVVIAVSVSDDTLAKVVESIIIVLVVAISWGIIIWLLQR